MSKLSKLINNPELFIVDAFKKKKSKVESSTIKTNELLKIIGLNKLINVQDIESEFLRLGLVTYEKTNLRKHLLLGLSIKEQLNYRSDLSSMFSNISKIKSEWKNHNKLEFKDEDEDECANSIKNYLSPQVKDILKILKSKG